MKKGEELSHTNFVGVQISSLVNVRSFQLRPIAQHMLIFPEVEYEPNTVFEQSVEFIQQNRIQVKVAHVTILEYRKNQNLKKHGFHFSWQKFLR